MEIEILGGILAVDLELSFGEDTVLEGKGIHREGLCTRRYRVRAEIEDISGTVRTSDGTGDEDVTARTGYLDGSACSLGRIGCGCSGR